MSNFLQETRKEIDVIDRQIMAALVRRFKITHKVGVYKKRHRLPPLDKKRESEVFAHKKILAMKHKLNPLLVEKIFKNIIAEVRKNHRHERNSGK
ncbi:MAG: chorismate mutase [Candidatus Azambacteria bacterium]|nr:chorismate mutase [Candidatus Azambacteria bacterium]